MFDEHVEFLERSVVEQQFDAFPGGQLALGVLRLDARLAAAKPGPGALAIESLDHLFQGKAPRPIRRSRPERMPPLLPRPARGRIWAGLWTQT
jgi:hypothetical protein